MTENNAAHQNYLAAHRAVSEVLEANSVFVGGKTINAIVDAVLSKLRAEGDPKPVLGYAVDPVGDAITKAAYVKVFGSASGWEDYAGSYFIEGYRAALASAPVAGEAISDKRLLLMMARWHLQMLNPDDLLDVTEFGRAAYAAGLADAAPQASEAVRNALWTLTEHNALHFGEQHNTVIQGRAALKTQADKDGGDCAKGASGLKRYVVLKALGSRYAYVNDTQEGRTVKRFDVIHGDGWEHASLLAARLNNAHFAALAAQPSGNSGELAAQEQEIRYGTNAGHGHAWERPDGFKGRCGGPGLCFECSADKAHADRVTGQHQKGENDGSR